MPHYQYQAGNNYLPPIHESFVNMMRVLPPDVYDAGESFRTRSIESVQSALIHRDEKHGYRCIEAISAVTMSGSAFERMLEDTGRDRLEAVGGIVVRAEGRVRIYPDPQGSERTRIQIQAVHSAMADRVQAVRFGGVVTERTGYRVGLSQIADDVIDIVNTATENKLVATAVIGRVQALPARYRATERGVL